MLGEDWAMLVGWGELVDQWMAIFNSNLSDLGPMGIQVLKIIWINVLLSGANAAAAKGHPWLIGFGLLVSIPLIVAGATLIMTLLSRFPILVWAGAGLLGWIAGELLMEDPVSRPYLDRVGMDYGLDHTAAEIAMQIACTLFVLLCG